MNAPDQPQCTITMDQIDQAYTRLDRLSPTAARLLMLMCGYEKGRWGECRAKASTLAEKMGCSLRTIRRALKALRDAGMWERVDRRMRWSARVLTDLGRLACRIILGEKFHLTKHTHASPISDPGGTADGTPCGTAQQREGKADLTPREEKSRNRSDVMSANPKIPDRIDPAGYQRPRQRGRLTASTWADLAAWMNTADSVSYARCRIAHRAFSGVVAALGASREWRWYEPTVRYRLMGSDAVPAHPEQVVQRAIASARRSGARFGTVESAVAYIAGIMRSCVRERRLPS